LQRKEISEEFLKYDASPKNNANKDLEVRGGIIQGLIK
jgi:hypothetical protein